MTGEEAKKEIIDMANALQLIPNTPKGKAVSMALKALEREPVLDKLDEIITKQIDISNNQVECQTLRWVLDVMSEMNVE